LSMLCTLTTASILVMVTTAPSGTEAVRALSMAASVMMALTAMSAFASTLASGGGGGPAGPEGLAAQTVSAVAEHLVLTFSVALHALQTLQLAPLAVKLMA